MGFKLVGVTVKLKSSVKIKYNNAIWKVTDILATSKANRNKTKVGKVYQQESSSVSQ